MVLQRKTLAIDEDIVNKLKEISRRRGTTLSNYLRQLFNEVIDIEERGYYAPKALRERKYEYILNNLGFIYIPRDLIASLRSNEISVIGNRLGVVLRELGVEITDIIDVLTRTSSNVIVESNKVILLAMPNTIEYYINKMVAELAKSLGLDVSDNDTLISIKIPEETIKSKLEIYTKGKK